MQSQQPLAPPQMGRRSVSLAIAIILLILGAAVGTGAGYFAFNRTTNTTTTVQTTLCQQGGTITIGELLDLSQTLSDQGTRAKDSSVLAINDINAMLSSSGCGNLKFATAIDDYALDDTKALNDLTAFASSGVQVVVGPLNSGTALHILSYANNHHIVLISPSSTSPALAIPNDYLFRTVPNDAAQGLADARIMNDRGATAVIMLARDDTYGEGLATATGNRFVALGGHVIDNITYDHTAADAGTLDWTATLAKLDSDFSNNVALYGASHIAIDAISFEEFASMITKASTFPSFPWSTIPWFGTDGEADNGKVIGGSGNEPALVAQVKLLSTLFATSNNTKTVTLYNTFASRYSPQTCDSYCLGAYDDLWLAALATLQAGSYNGTAIAANMLAMASNYYGVTGLATLQPSGDRVPTAYQIWEVVNQGSPAVPTWVQSGTWDNGSDSVSWSPGYP